MHKSEIVNRGPANDNLFIVNKNINVSKSPYAAYEDKEEEELVYKGKRQYVNIENIILQAQIGNLKIRDDDNIDLEILKTLMELEFATSRMITNYLYIKGFDKHQKEIQKRLIYLSKIKAVSAYEFRSKDKDGNERRSHTSIYYLDSGSEFILKSQSIQISKDNLNASLKSKCGIKEALSRNQLMLSYVSHIENIEFTKISPTYKLAGGENLIPDLLMVFNKDNKKEYFFFEVIRAYSGWQNKMIQKQMQYKQFIEGFNPSKTIQTVPQLIIVGEDDVHAFDIFKTLLLNDCIPKNQRYIFTTDNRVLSEKIKDNGLFIFDLKENNEVHLNIINPKLFTIIPG